MPASLKPFKNAKVTFLAKYRELACSPFGSTVQRVVNTPGGPVVVVDSKPEVRFSNNLYQTADAELARAMIAQSGFGEIVQIDEESLPKEIRSGFQRLPAADRRTVLLAIIDGKSPLAALGMIDVPPPIVESDKPSSAYSCPVCKEAILGKHPQALLVTHVRSQHPDYEGPIA